MQQKNCKISEFKMKIPIVVEFYFIHEITARVIYLMLS